MLWLKCSVCSLSTSVSFDYLCHFYKKSTLSEDYCDNVILCYDNSVEEIELNCIVSLLISGLAVVT